MNGTNCIPLRADEECSILNQVTDEARVATDLCFFSFASAVMKRDAGDRKHCSYLYHVMSP
ncbi:hypothetical protein PAECIP112173_01382 [Paenibacillus sp. JJ-100]|nr:hypothetical protein PAECIP112173_01382 [Paenibacillus sp. JJ-100]